MNMTVHLQAAQALENGARYITGMQGGWWGGRNPPHGAEPLCAAQAVGHFTTERSRIRNLALDSLARAVGDKGGWERIYQWNDAPGRTAVEVAAMMLTVAATLRAQAGSRVYRALVAVPAAIKSVMRSVHQRVLT